MTLNRYGLSFLTWSPNFLVSLSANISSHYPRNSVLRLLVKLSKECKVSMNCPTLNSTSSTMNVSVSVVSNWVDPSSFSWFVFTNSTEDFSPYVTDTTTVAVRAFDFVYEFFTSLVFSFGTNLLTFWWVSNLLWRLIIEAVLRLFSLLVWHMLDPIFCLIMFLGWFLYSLHGRLFLWRLFDFLSNGKLEEIFPFYIFHLCWSAMDFSFAEPGPNSLPLVGMCLNAVKTS